MPKPFQVGLALAFEGNISEAVSLMQVELTSLAEVVAANSIASSNENNNAVFEGSTPWKAPERSPSGRDSKDFEPTEIGEQLASQPSAVMDVDTINTAGLGVDTDIRSRAPSLPTFAAEGTTRPIKPSQLIVTTGVVPYDTVDRGAVATSIADVAGRTCEARRRDERFATASGAIATPVPARSAVSATNSVSNTSPKLGPTQQPGPFQPLFDPNSAQFSSAVPLPSLPLQRTSDQSSSQFPEPSASSSWWETTSKDDLLPANVASASFGGNLSSESVSANASGADMTTDGQELFGAGPSAPPALGTRSGAAGVEHGNSFAQSAPESFNRLNDRNYAGGIQSVATGNKGDTLFLQKRPAARRVSDEEEQADSGREVAGDIFFDGVLLGRWMSRLLNKEAGRASIGPTGYDIRRGRLLPGPSGGV